MSQPAILVDFREKESGVPEKLLNEGIPVSFTNLEVGDYQFGDVIIERKEIHDYLQSKTSGHLDRQLYDMSNSCDLSYLFVHADPIKHPRSPTIQSALMELGVPRASYFSSLIGSSFKTAPCGQQGRIVTMTFDTVPDMVLTMKFLYNKVKENDCIRVPRFKRKGISPDEQLVYIVSSLPDIGEVRARNILNNPDLNTIAKLANAKVEDFKSVPKIYLKIAENLVALFNLPYHNNGEQTS